MARIVVRDPETEPLARPEAPGLDQLEKQLGVVEHRPAPAEVGVLVPESVVAVRVGREEALEAALGDGRHVLVHERRVETFLADAANVSTRVALAVIEDSEVDACVVEHLGERLRHLLIARIEGGVIADEPEMLGGRFANVLDVEGEIPGPAAAFPLRLSEGVSGRVDGLERLLELRVHVPLLDEAPAHVVDDRHVLDPDGADLDARHALHAPTTARSGRRRPLLLTARRRSGPARRATRRATTPRSRGRWPRCGTPRK